MGGGDVSNPGQLADKQMLRPPHEVGQFRMSCRAQSLKVGRSKTERVNGDSEHPRFVNTPFFLSFLVSLRSDFVISDKFLATD